MGAYTDAALTRPPSSDAGTAESLTSSMAVLSVGPKTKKSDYPLAAGDPDSGGFDLLVKARNAPVFVPRAMRQPSQHQYHMQQQQAYANNRVHPRQQYRSTQSSPSHPSSRDGDVETASTASGAAASDSGTEVAGTSQRPMLPKPSVQYQPRPGYVSPVPQHEKPTAAQLDEKMARMRQINADVTAKSLAQESDAKAYEEGIAADRAALEEKERRLAIATATVEAARRDAAERKLANMQGRAWDADKEVAIPVKNEPKPAPASSEPVAAALAVTRTFERSAPPHLPHLPSPRLQRRRPAHYAPSSVPTADVVARSDLIGWGTPPATPPAQGQAQHSSTACAPVSTPANTHISDQANWRAVAEPVVESRAGQQQHSISTAPAQEQWPTRLPAQEHRYARQPGDVELDRPSFHGGVTIKAEIQPVSHAPHGPRHSPQLEQAYLQTFPQVQQNAWNGVSSAGGWPAQSGHPAPSTDASKAGAPQQTSYRAQAPTLVESQCQDRSTAERLLERDCGAPLLMEGRAQQPYDPARVPSASVVASVFANDDDEGWGVFDPMTSSKTNASATAEQDTYMSPPQSYPQPTQNRPSFTTINRGTETSRWAPKAVMGSREQSSLDQSSLNKPARWRRDAAPSALLPVREAEGSAWEVSDKHPGDRLLEVQDGHDGGVDNDRYPAARTNPLQVRASSPVPAASASNADGGWGGSFQQAHPQPKRSPPSKSSSGGLATDAVSTGSRALAPGASQGGWGGHRQLIVEGGSNCITQSTRLVAFEDPSDPPLVPELSPNPQEGHRLNQTITSSALPVAVQSEEWYAHPPRIPEPQQSTNWSQGGRSASQAVQTGRVLSQTISTQPPDLRAASSLEIRPGKTNGGWNSPPAVQQAAPQIDNDGWPVCQNGQEHTQYQQPHPYSQQQQQRQQQQQQLPPAAPMLAPSAAPTIYVHPDRLAAVPNSATSPPVQQFGFAGKGFGFGGGKNLRIERDDSSSHRHGFERRVSSGGRDEYDAPPNAGGGANAIPIAGRPQWGSGNSSRASSSYASPHNGPYASRPSVVEARPSLVQEQAAPHSGGWGVAKNGDGHQDLSAW